MTRPRKQPARTTRKPAAIKAVKRPAPQTRARASSSENEDIFIPKRSTAPGTAAPVDDEEIYIARAGPPVEVQGDFVEDFDTWPMDDGDGGSDETHPGDARAMTPAGWTPDELRMQGLELVRGGRHAGEARCRYGCVGGTSNVAGVSAHAWNCVYWQSPEGRTKTPF